MHDELMRDPQGLAERLLIAIATEHARTRNSRVIRPSDLLSEAAWLVRRAIATCAGHFDKAPIIAPLMRWRFQRHRRKLRRQRGLSWVPAWNTDLTLPPVVSKVLSDSTDGVHEGRVTECWSCVTFPSALRRASRWTM